MRNVVVTLAAAALLGAASHLGGFGAALIAAAFAGGWVGFRMSLDPFDRGIGDAILLGAAGLIVGLAALPSALSLIG